MQLAVKSTMLALVFGSASASLGAPNMQVSGVDSSTETSSFSSDSETSTSGNSIYSRYSLTTNFPSGGSQPMSNSLGARMRLDNNAFLSGAILYSDNTDNAEDRGIFGLSVKYQSFVTKKGRARPYYAGSLYHWKPNGDGNTGKDNAALGLSGSFGVELWFIRELSAFIETGIFLDKSNVDKTETEFGTFTSALGLNFNFDR